MKLIKYYIELNEEKVVLESKIRLINFDIEELINEGKPKMVKGMDFTTGLERTSDRLSTGKIFNQLMYLENEVTFLNDRHKIVLAEISEITKSLKALNNIEYNVVMMSINGKKTTEIAKICSYTERHIQRIISKYK